jgi:hypothetical protein
MGWSRPCIMSHSFQLPDLLGIISCLELRTNRFCPFATDTSEKWFFEETNNCISPAELSYLRSTKLGLLAALCFPTCDAPQLRLLTDFLTMLFYSNIRALSFTGTGHSSNSIQAMWHTTERNSDESATRRESGLDILENHVLFKQFSKKKKFFSYIHPWQETVCNCHIHKSAVWSAFFD